MKWRNRPISTGIWVQKLTKHDFYAYHIHSDNDGNLYFKHRMSIHAESREYIGSREQGRWFKLPEDSGESIAKYVVQNIDSSTRKWNDLKQFETLSEARVEYSRWRIYNTHPKKFRILRTSDGKVYP